MQGVKSELISFELNDDIEVLSFESVVRFTFSKCIALKEVYSVDVKTICSKNMQVKYHCTLYSDGEAYGVTDEIRRISMPELIDSYLVVDDNMKPLYRQELNIVFGEKLANLLKYYNHWSIKRGISAWKKGRDYTKFLKEDFLY